jgi:nucleoside-diphosphate-sugar epimerase
MTEQGLTGRLVFVSGATGCIGSRLVERLVTERGARVRALSRTVARTAWISRYQVEIVVGDVRDPECVKRASRGCDIVFHCAYGNSGSEAERRQVNVEGTRNVLDAAIGADVRRIVYLSTLMVYGATADGVLDESAPRRYFGNVYSDSKLDAERLALEYAQRRNAPVVILQPTAVYGPFASPWTVNVLRSLTTGSVILVNGGDGLCNAVYVDDLIDAMLLAATCRGVAGEVFLISGETPVPWRTFYEYYERMVGARRTISMSVPDALADWERRRRKPGSLFTELKDVLRGDAVLRQRLAGTRELLLLRHLVLRLLPAGLRRTVKARILARPAPGARVTRRDDDPPVHPLSPQMVTFLHTKTSVSIAKAKQFLGYQPHVDLPTGMRLTEEWARWAGHLPVKPRLVQHDPLTERPLTDDPTGSSC